MGSGMILESPIYSTVGNFHEAVIMRKSSEDCKCFEACPRFSTWIEEISQ